MNKRNYSIDSLKFFCILRSIYIHIGAFYGMELGFYRSEYLGTILNTIVRVCVSLFFLSPGYLLLNKCNAEYTKKYVISLAKVLLE